MPKVLSNALERFLDDPKNTLKWPDEEERRAVAVVLTTAPADASDSFDVIVKFEDGAAPEWVHLVTYGTFEHPIFGQMTFTEEVLDNYIKNFKKKVLGIMLNIDYAHKNDPSKGKKAAGWIVALEKRDDGLWGKISWTSEAAAEISDGAWKYMSIEFSDKWCTSKEPIRCYDDILFGAALTNQPFVKDLTPINFDDFFTTPPGKFTPEEAHYGMASDSMYRCANCVFFRGNSCLLVDGTIEPDMTCEYFKPIYNDALDHMGMYDDKPLEEVKVDEFLKKLRERLQLAEDASEEDILKAFEEAAKPTEKPTEEPAKVELEEQVVSKKFAEQFPEEAARMVALEETNRRLDTQAMLSAWRDGEKGGLPVSLDESIIDFRIKLSDTTAFDGIISSIVKTGLVPRKELGSTRRNDDESDSDQFINAVKKYQEEHDGVTFEAAVRAVSKSEPALAKAYLEDRRQLSGAAEPDAEGGES